VNALADARVAQFLNDNFVCTYLKVGAFKIIGGQKVGGNVATYYCLPDGAVLHAIAGKTDANRLLTESRWAIDIRKSAQTFSTNLGTGKTDLGKFAGFIRKAHGERYHEERHTVFGDRNEIPKTMPLAITQTAQTHWLLAKQPMARLDTIYPVVWRQILREELSALPVERR
jgi:hypothetical protein